MTNLLNLPQIPAGSIITILSNCDWDDQWFVPQLGFVATPVVLTGTFSSSSPIISAIASTAGVVPNMLAQGPGVPPGTTVVSVTSSSVTLSANPTFSAPVAGITFFPPPLDLTGISFSSELRINLANPSVLLSMSTTNGLMTNGATSGIFGWDISSAQMAAAPWPSGLAALGTLACVMDIIATDATGAKVNMCADNGPITVNVNLSVTR